MRWLGLINLILIGMILLVGGLCVISAKNEDEPIIVERFEPKELPKSLFATSEESFQAIGQEGMLALNWMPPQMQLPDLRQELLFCGKNARPDSMPGKATFQLSLKSSGQNALVKEGVRTYLVYQGTYYPKGRKTSVEGRNLSSSHALWGEVSNKQETETTPYIFSPDNQVTPLWFEIKSYDETTLMVHVSMIDEKGMLVSSPTECCTFQIRAQDVAKNHHVGWELGKYRADTTLLVRQKARWAGSDLFLALHGGDDFKRVIGKERIDFLDGDLPYSCFVTSGDFLIWKNERWHEPLPEEGTQSFPLLAVKKIDEKILSFELWDCEGRGKIALSLIRAKDHHPKLNLSQEMKFVGAKTWAQFIVESRSGGRMVLKINDWLVLTQEGWVKLDSIEKIDAYVNQSMTGPLFILEKMVKNNGRQVLIGHLFNSLRTEVEEIELTSAAQNPLANYCRPPLLTPPIQPKPVEHQGDAE